MRSLLFIHPCGLVEVIVGNVCFFKCQHPLVVLMFSFVLLLWFVCLSCSSDALLKLVSVRNLDVIFFSARCLYQPESKRLTGIFELLQKFVSKRDKRVHQRSSIYEVCSKPGSVFADTVLPWCLSRQLT